MIILHYLTGNICSFMCYLFSTNLVINLSDDELHKRYADANWLKRVYIIIAALLSIFCIVGGFIGAIVFFGLLFFNKVKSAYALGTALCLTLAGLVFPLALVEFYVYVNKTLIEIYSSELASRSLIATKGIADYFI